MAQVRQISSMRNCFVTASYLRNGNSNCESDLVQLDNADDDISAMKVIEYDQDGLIHY